MSDGKYWTTKNGTYTGDLSIDVENPFEHTAKTRSRESSPSFAQNKVRVHFRNAFKPIIKEELGII